MPRYPGMIIVRQILFLRDRDRYEDRFSHRVTFECDVDREHLRHCLYYCFVDRIWDAIPERVALDKCVGFSDKFTSYPLRVPAGQEANKTEDQNYYDMPDFHGRTIIGFRNALYSSRTSKQGHALINSNGSTMPLSFRSGEVSRWPSSSTTSYT